METKDYSEPHQSKTESYKCDGCGATMHYDAEARALKCDYCGSIKKLEFSDDITERDFSEMEGAEKWVDGIKTVVCKNCGAREVYRADEVAKVCPFCHSPMVVSTDNISGIKPNVVVPFAISQNNAEDLCRKWLKKRFYAPRKFKKNLKINDVQGIYYPVWTFDSQTMTDYDGILGRYVTKTRRVNGKTETYTEIEYFPVSGQIFKIFDDITVNGSTMIPDNDIDKEHFSQDSYVKFDDAYLQGYSANSYSVNPLDAWKKAEDKMREAIKQEILNKHNASVVSHLNMRMYHEGRSFKYMLVPLYISATEYKKKLYKQYIHGVTGKVSGKTPLSAIKIIITAILALGLAGLLIYLFMMADSDDYSQRINDILSLIKSMLK